jgi:acetyltransferase-like isoleucine patch superfamily enzyme
VGDRTVFGPYTMIHTANHRMDDVDRAIVDQGWVEGGPPVRIGKDCWIGMGVCILPGVEIGDGCVVGAGAVVTSDLEPFTVAVGNPAKGVRNRRS